jgi:rSAM/selenodomain-associated transferase 1
MTHSRRDSVAIAVVAKAPVAGQVKTRMQPPLTPSQAAGLAVAMLADVTAAALATGAAVWWSYAGSRAVLDDLRPSGVRLLEQVGDGLGPRLAHTHRVLHEGGHDRVLVVGADCPTVDAAALTMAVDLLDCHDVVIGPASDGGYTLLGTTTCSPALFTDVPMSTAHTGADTIAVAERLGLRVALTEPRPDLDTFADLVSALDGGWLAAAPFTRRLAEQLVGNRITAGG